MELFSSKFELDFNNPMIVSLIELIVDFRAQVNKFILLTELDQDQFYSAMNHIFMGYLENILQKDLEQPNPIYYDMSKNSDLEKGMSILEKSRIPFFLDQACSLAMATICIEALTGELANMKLDEECTEQYNMNLSTICKANWLASGAINDLKARFQIQYENTVNIHLQGAQARSEKYKNKKEQAFKMFRDGSFYSYAECARAIHEKLGIKDPNTVARWLSEMNKKI